MSWDKCQRISIDRILGEKYQIYSIRCVYHSDCCIQLSFGASRIALDGRVLVSNQIHSFKPFFHLTMNAMPWCASNPSHVFQDLVCCHVRIQCIHLWTVTKQRFILEWEKMFFTFFFSFWKKSQISLNCLFLFKFEFSKLKKYSPKSIDRSSSFHWYKSDRVKQLYHA